MSQTPDILRKILTRKSIEILERSEVLNLRALSVQVEASPEPRGFLAAIEKRVQQGKTAVIAEIKKASPSKGILREHFNPAEIAQDFFQAGATCLSVLTDQHFFQGSDAYLKQARAACPLPLLRKDFIIDPYQVYEARVLGADCILLIVAALGDTSLKELSLLAMELKMDVLIEIHNREELERALALPVRLLGINNRNLSTFETTLGTTLTLSNYVPKDKIIVTESGIQSATDIKQIRSQGIHTFLIGESFMKAEHPGKQLALLFPD